MTSTPPTGLRSPVTGSDQQLAGVTVLIASMHPAGHKLADKLHDYHCSIRLLESASALNKSVRQREPDVLMVDEELPGIHGAVQRMDDAGGHHRRVLLISTYSPEAVGRALDLGVETFMCRQTPVGEVVRRLNRELVEGGLCPAIDEFDAPRMVGSSDQAYEICHKVAAMAPADATVLITGESGTGKELVARWIHRFSPRRDGPFVPLNCGAIPAQLVESKLFGHVEGAFTGATEDRPGLFEVADGGTLFLDEVGELPPQIQVKLLRVLQQRRFEPVGGTQSITTDVRLIAATNVDLKRAVEQQQFRRDLYYRLNVLHLDVPPLRERPEDIVPLWRHFLRTFAHDTGRDEVDTDPDTLRRLLAYRWPGNVRELENAARHAVVMRDRTITPRGLPTHLRGEDPTAGTGPTAGNSSAQHPASIRIPGMSLDELERIAILRTVDSTETVAEAAEILGVSERTLYYRLKEYRGDGD